MREDSIDCLEFVKVVRNDWVDSKVGSFELVLVEIRAWWRLDRRSIMAACFRWVVSSVEMSSVCSFIAF